MNHLSSVLSRRRIQEHTAMAAGAAAAMAAIADTARAAEKVSLHDRHVILFQGDSITDAGRHPDGQGRANDPAGMGEGYAALISSGLLRDHAELRLQIYNRGISGNRVPDLDQRWQRDCLDLQPALLSILIGVNDMWHKLSGDYDASVAAYHTGLAELLTKTRATVPDTIVVMCEPFVLRCGAVNAEWIPEFDDRRAAARRVADAAGAIWVPFQTMFDAAVAAGIEPAYWAADGVHPSLPGHVLMAKTWRQVVGI